MTRTIKDIIIPFTFSECALAFVLCIKVTGITITETMDELVR